MYASIYRKVLAVVQQKTLLPSNAAKNIFREGPVNHLISH